MGKKSTKEIYGGVKENEQYKTRTNQELYDLFTSLTIVQSVRAQRIRWLGSCSRRKCVEESS